MFCFLMVHFTAMQVLWRRRGLDTLTPMMEMTPQLIGLIFSRFVLLG